MRAGGVATAPPLPSQRADQFVGNGPGGVSNASSKPPLTRVSSGRTAEQSSNCATLTPAMPLGLVSEQTKNVPALLDLSARTQGWDDCGLLGLAFHPQFGQPGSTNRGYFYLFYQFSLNPTRGPGRPPRATPAFNRLARFTVPDGSSVADPDSELGESVRRKGKSARSIPASECVPVDGSSRRDWSRRATGSRQRHD